MFLGVYCGTGVSTYSRLFFRQVAVDTGTSMLAGPSDLVSSLQASDLSDVNSTFLQFSPSA